MNNESVDVAVVGGGPAGLTAAAYAAKKGLSLRVYEKKGEIGFPVNCGELLPSIKEMYNLLPKTKDVSNLFDVPNSVITNRCKKFRVFSPRGKAWEFSFEANVLDRPSFEKNLAERAKRAGAEIFLGAPAKLFLKGRTRYVGKARKDAVKAKIVIVADGFPSRIGLTTGLFKSYMTRNHTAMVYQYRMLNVKVEEDTVEMFFDSKYAPGGFAYIIPKGENMANVGIGIRASFAHGKTDARGCLNRFITKHHSMRDRLSMGKPTAVMADVLPIDGPISKTVNDSVMMIGDAAGMVIPTTGAGIPTAMITGKIAGEVAAENLIEGSSLYVYEGRWKEQIGNELYTCVKVRRMADKFIKNDFLLHFILKLLGSSGIKKVLTCKNPLGPVVPDFL